MERAIVARHDNKNIAHMRIIYQHTETWIPLFNNDKLFTVSFWLIEQNKLVTKS